MVGFKVREISIVTLLWLILAVYFAALKAFDALFLWCILSIIFGSMFWCAVRYKNIMLTCFMGFMFISHAIAPSLFFMQDKSRPYSGWGAVRDFSFDVWDFLGIYSHVVFYIFLTLVFTVLLQKVFYVKKTDDTLLSPIFSDKTAKAQTTGFFADIWAAGKKHVNFGGNARTKLKYGGLIVVVLLFAAVLNNWMYQRGLSMTGVKPNIILPFRMVGVLHYFTRFLFPVFVGFLYARSSRTWWLIGLIMVYALWVGTSQLSRFTASVYIVPILLIDILEWRWIRVIICFWLFSVIYSIVTIARSNIYLVSSGQVYANLSCPLWQVLWNIFNTPGVGKILMGQSLIDLVLRLKGVQDVILGSQISVAEFGGSLNEFKRVFFGIKTINPSEITYLMYGFVPPRGFSPGVGGISCSVIMISDGKWWILVLVSLWISLVLTMCEWVVQSYQKLFKMKTLGFLLGVSIMIIFFTITRLLPNIYIFMLIMGVLLHAIKKGRYLPREGGHNEKFV